jgi:hypothetical protein
MDGDLWRQWQSMAALFMSGASTVPPAFGASAPSAGADYAAAAERFGADAQRFFAAAAAEPGSTAAIEAARLFSDALRERFAALPPMLRETSGAGGSGNLWASLGAAAPALGPMREQQLRWQRTLEAFGRMTDAQHRLQRLWGDALREAAETFIARVRAAPAGVLDAQRLQALYDQWIDCAEQAYARVAHGEAFAEALADSVNAASAWRRGLQDSLEHWAGLLDLPTRSEINTILGRLRELERRAPMPSPPETAQGSDTVHPARPRRRAAARRAGKRKS